MKLVSFTPLFAAVNVLTIIGFLSSTLAFSRWLSSRGKKLLTSKAYRYVRHPQYAGLILGTLGLTVLSGRPVSMIGWLTLVAGCLILGSMEEREMLTKIGGEYDNYMRSTAFMIPFLKIESRTLSLQKPSRYLIVIGVYTLLVVFVMFFLRAHAYSLR
ncbi:MAG: hypothetical protein AOA65_1707 [Candidatus Bathyarchaeota archaeon BA1]|nr:MAG: hypothetical protein AOA65_1707 [Candidatus Bathyarchaeota archaeon BA1]